MGARLLPFFLRGDLGSLHADEPQAGLMCKTNYVLATLQVDEASSYKIIVSYDLLHV